MRAISLLAAAGVDWNALTTVHRASEGRGAEVYRFLRDEAGAGFIQFIPIVERPTRDGVPFGPDVTSRSVTPTGYGTFMRDVFDEWVRHDVGEVYVQAFDTALAAWVGEPIPLCVFAPECGSSLAMEFNGDVYSCDHFVEPAHLIGNIRTPSSRRPRVEPRAVGLRARTRPNGFRDRVWTAPPASPATAAVRRTDSCPIPAEGPTSTICAPAIWTSSGTWTSRCGSWRRRSSRDSRRHSSWKLWRSPTAQGAPPGPADRR